MARKSSHEEINPIFQGAIGSRCYVASKGFDPSLVIVFQPRWTDKVCYFFLAKTDMFFPGGSFRLFLSSFEYFLPFHLIEECQKLLQLSKTPIKYIVLISLYVGFILLFCWLVCLIYFRMIRSSSIGSDLSL